MMSNKKYTNNNDKKVFPTYEFLIALVFVYGNGSWLYTNFNQYYSIFLVVFCFAIILVENKYKHIQTPNILIGMLILIPIVSTVFNHSAKQNYNNLISTTLLTFLIAYLEKKFISRILNEYSKIIYYLAIISIPMGVFYLIFPDRAFVTLTNNPEYKFGHIGGYFNYYLYTENIFQDFRTQSIFWEPGAWAINQLFAIYWLVIRNKQLFYFPIFIISLFLTLSTTGFILLTIILFSLFFSKSQIKQKKIVLKYLLISFIISFLVISYYFNKYSTSIINFIGEQTLYKFQYGSATYGSHYERTATTLDAWNLTMNNILLGNGRTTHLYITSTIAQILYQTGIPYTLLYVSLFSRVFMEMGVILFVPFSLIMLNGEAYGYHVLFILLTVLGSKIIMGKNENLNSYSNI